MDSLCADSEDCEEMNLDIDNSGAVREKVADELADASNVEHSLNGSLCSECPCPSIGTEVSPQPVVATVAVHKSLGVWFGEDGSVVQIHPGGQVAESGVQRGDLLAGMNDLLISDAQEIRHELSRLRGGSEAEASLLFCPGDAPDCVATACPGFGHRLSLEEIVARAAELAAEDVEVEDGADSELGAVAEAKIGADEEMEENEENRAEEKEKQELAAAEEDAAEAAASKAGNNDVLAEVIKSKDAEAAEAASNPWSGVFNVKWVHAIGAKSAPPRTAELAAAEGVEAPAAAVENAPPAKPSKSTWAGWLTGAPPPIPNEEAVIEEAPSNEGLDEDGSSSSSPEDEPLTQEEHEEEKEEEASETPSTAMGEAQETAEVTQESDEGEALDEEAAAAEVEAAAAEEEVDTGGAVVPPRTGEENDANVEELSNAGEEAAEAGADEASNTVEVAGADVEGATMVEDAAVDTEETEAQVAASLDAMAEEAERTEEAVTEEMPAASSVEVEEVEDSPAADPENTPAFPEQPEPESLPEMDESAAAAAVVGDEVAVAPQVEEEALPPKASTSSWGWGWFSTTPTEKPAAAPEAIAEETAPEKGETVVDSVAEENSGEELATVDKETSVEEEEAPVEEETSVDTEAVVEETPVDNSSVDATVAEFVVTAADEVPIEGSSAEDVTVEETAAQEASLVDFADEAKEAAAAAIRTALEAEGFDANEIEAIVEQHLAETAAEDEATMAAEQAAAAAAAEELAWKTAATAEPDAASIVARLQAMSALEEQAKEEAAKVAAAAAAEAAEAAAFVPAEPSRHAVAIEEFEAAAPGVSPTTVLVNPSIAEVANAAAASAAASAMEGAKEDQAATGASAESKSWWGWMTTAPTPLASDTKGAPNTKNEAVDSTTASDGQNNAEMTVAMGEGEPSVVAPLVLDEPTVEVEAVVEEAAETVEAKEIITEESGEVETEEVQAAEKEETAGESPNDQAGDEGQREGGFSEMAETAQSPASDDSAGVSVNQDLPTIHDDSSTDTQLEEVVPAAEDASSQETSVKDDAVTEAITSPEVPAVETPAAVVAPGSWWSSYFPSLTGGATTKEAQSVQIPIAPQEEEDMPTRDSKEAEKEETSDEVNAATVDFESPAEGDEASAGAAETGAPSEEVETVAAEVAEAPPHEEEAVTTEAEDSADEVAKALQGEDVAESGTAEEAILAEQEMLATADLVVGEEETSIDQVAAEDEASKLAEVDDNANGTSEAQNSVEDPAIEATESDASATVATTAVDSEVALAPQVEEEEALSPKAAASSWGWGWFSTTPTEKPAAAPETIAEKTAQEEGETANEEESAGAAVATDDSAALLTATDAQPDAQEGEPGEIVATAELEMEVLSAEAGPVLVVGDDPGSAAPSEHGEVRLEEDEIAASVDVVESAPPHEADVSENMPDLSTDVPVLEEGVPDDEAASMTEDVAAESNEGEDAAAPAGTDTMAAEIESDETMAPTEELSPLPETAPAPDEPLEESKPAEKSSSLWGWFSSSSSSSSSTVPKPDDAGADVDSANVLQDDTSLPAAESKEEDEAPVAEAAPEEKHEDEGAAPQPLEIASGDAEEEEEDLADTVAEVKQEPSTEAESVEEKEEEATDIIKESVDAPIDDEAEESGIAQDTVISANATETVQAVVAAGQEALATSSALNSSSSSGSLVVDVAVVDSSWSEENAATVVTMPGFGESDGRFEAIVEEAFVEVDRYITEVALAQLYPQPLPPGPLDPALCGDGDLPCAISASEIGADVLASFRPHARLHSALASRSQLRQTLAAHRAAALRASLEWGAGSLLVVALAIGLWIFKGRPNFIGERAQEGSESTDEVHGASSVQEPPLTVPVKLTMKPQVHFQEERQQQEGASKSSVVRTLDKEGFRHAAASSSPSSSSPKGGPLSPVVLSSIEERGKWQSMREASMAYANAPTSASSSSEGSPSIMPTMHQSSSHASLSSPSAATATTAAGATGAGAAVVTPSAATGGAGNSDDDASSAFDLRALRDQLADTPDRYAALERAHAALRANPDALSAFADLASSPTGGDEDDEEEADVGVANAVQNEAESAAETTLAETKARAVTPSRSSASALESSAPLFMLEYCDPVRKADKAMVLEAVRRNGLELRFAAPKLQDDREVVLAACAQNGGALVAASKQLRADKQVVLVATRRWPDAIRFASEDLKADKEVVLTAASQDGRVLQFASPSLRDDRALVLQCCGQDGRALEFASPRLQADTMVCLAAMRERPPCLRFASPTLRSNAVFMLSAARRAGRAALTCAEGRLRTDRKFFFACLTSDGNALEVAPFELCDDDEAVLLAVKHSKGNALQHASRRLRSDTIFVTKCVEVDGRALAHAAPSLRLQPSLIAAAARNTPRHWGSSHVHEERHALLSLESPSSAPMPQEFNILSPPQVNKAGSQASTTKGRSVLRSASPRKGLASPVMSPRGPGDVGSPGSPHPVRRVNYVSERREATPAPTSSIRVSSNGASSTNARNSTSPSANTSTAATPIVSASGFGWKTTQTPSGSFVRVWAPVNE